jgi:hypothetical protein
MVISSINDCMKRYLRKPGSVENIANEQRGEVPDGSNAI